MPTDEPSSSTPEMDATTFRVMVPVYGGLFTARPGPPTPAAHDRELPFVLEGELVRIGETGDGLLPPTQIEVVESSPVRVSPGCSHFGLCGGCQYQHMAQSEQVRTKSELLQGMFQRRKMALPAHGIHTHTSEPWRYRNRARLRLQDGQIGYNRRKSNEFLPIRECPVVSPLLWRTAQALEEQQGIWPTQASEVELFANGTDEGLQLSLHLNADVTSIDRAAPAQFRRMCDALQVKVPELQGAGLLVQAAPDARASRRIQERQRVEVARWGAPGLAYPVGDRTYAVSRNAFFQVNRFLTGKMIDLVAGDRTGALALDLFAGAGLFSVALADRFTRVVAVEIGQPAADDLKNALRACGPQHRAEHKTTLAFLREWNRQYAAETPDLVVMDPPRAGLGREVVTELLRLGAAELVYVSCDPTTFVRDCAALVESRYTLDDVHLLDLFPQTFHMETVAIFRRR